MFMVTPGPVCFFTLLLNIQCNCLNLANSIIRQLLIAVSIIEIILFNKSH